MNSYQARELYNANNDNLSAIISSALYYSLGPQSVEHRCGWQPVNRWFCASSTSTKREPIICALRNKCPSEVAAKCG